VSDVVSGRKNLGGFVISGPPNRPAVLTRLAMGLTVGLAMGSLSTGFFCFYAWIYIGGHELPSLLFSINSDHEVC
jgi:hypothetical protein